MDLHFLVIVEIYICLTGIQHYLYLNGRIDNIFADVYYSRFAECLNELLGNFEMRLNEQGLCSIFLSKLCFLYFIIKSHESLVDSNNPFVLYIIIIIHICYTQMFDGLNEYITSVNK